MTLFCKRVCGELSTYLEKSSPTEREVRTLKKKSMNRMTPVHIWRNVMSTIRAMVRNTRVERKKGTPKVILPQVRVSHLKRVSLINHGKSTPYQRRFWRCFKGTIRISICENLRNFRNKSIGENLSSNALVKESAVLLFSHVSNKRQCCVFPMGACFIVV